jgi:hypothetical protein
MADWPLLPHDVLEYFRSVLQAEPQAEPWHIWWERHAEELRGVLRPGHHLRLRMGYISVIRELLAAAGYTWEEPASRFNPKFHRPELIPSAWLTQQVASTEVEAKLPPDGYLCDLWRWLVSQMEPQDQIWSFSSPPETWRRLMGASGFALVRNGKAYDSVVMLEN